MPPRATSSPHRTFTPPRAIGRALQVVKTLAQSSRPMSLADLCAEFNVPRTSLFAILKGLERDGYVTFVEAESALRFSVKAGAVKPLSASASGHAVLAHLPAPERNAYLKSGPFQRFTPGTVTTASELRKAIARVRREHCAMTINGADAISRILGYTAPYPPPPP